MSDPGSNITDGSDGSGVEGLTEIEKGVAIVVYTAIMLFAILGNLLVIIVVLWFKHMRALPMNFLILNLAFAGECMVCTMVIP